MVVHRILILLLIVFVLYEAPLPLLLSIFLLPALDLLDVLDIVLQTLFFISNIALVDELLGMRPPHIMLFLLQFRFFSQSPLIIPCQFLPLVILPEEITKSFSLFLCLVFNVLFDPKQFLHLG